MFQSRVAKNRTAQLAALLCLIPLGIIALPPTISPLWPLIPQSSFGMWVGLELIILLSAGLAIGLSVWRFWEQSAGLKVLAVVTMVFAGVLGALEAFWFL